MVYKQSERLDKMTFGEKFQKKNDELLLKVTDELQQAKVTLDNKKVLQLESILKEIQKTQGETLITLSYPRMIIDSWDYADSLGTELLEFAEMYKKLSAKLNFNMHEIH